MLVWSTEMPMNPDRSPEEVLAIAKKWVTGSPHAQWTPELLPEARYGEIQTAEINKDNISVALIQKANEKWGGFQYVKPEAEAEWTTEIVCHHTCDTLLVSVSIQCDLQCAQPKAPKPKKPYIIRQLLKEIGGGIDGKIHIKDKPYILKEADIDTAIRIVRGQLNNHLPVIYASSTWRNTPVVNANKLALWASGLAHVVVEPSCAFSHVLARNTERQNVYGGSIGIYWPKQNGHRAVLSPEQFNDPDQLSHATEDLVRRALLNRSPTEDCTWSFIKEAISSTRLETVRQSGSKQLSDYIEVFDNEIKSKEQHIAKLEKDATRLRLEIQRLQARADANHSGILTSGTESPYYCGEIRDALIKALEAGKNQLMPNGRCRHIVEDVLTHNRMSADEHALSDKIRTTLSSCQNIGREQQRTLEQLGFSFREDGKHIEATYHDDNRYAFTMPKTGSDWRGMKNQASDILRTLFK